MSKLTNMNTKMNTKITTMSKLANHYRQHRQHNQYSQYKRYKQYKLFLSLPLALLASFLINLMFTNTTQAATFTVTNTNDSGAGSLRQAIEDANSNANPGTQDVINFNIAGAGDHTIQPLASLDITQSVLINGYTQGDAEENTALAPLPMTGTLRVAVDQNVAGKITVTSNNVTLRGLVLFGSPDYAVEVVQSNNFHFYGNYVNTHNNGMISTTLTAYSNPNSDAGIILKGSSNAQIGGSLANQRNVIGACLEACIVAESDGAFDSSNLVVKGNNISVGADSITDISSGTVAVGVVLRQGSNDAVIGGDNQGEGNFISFLQTQAIFARDVDNLTIKGNRILEIKGYSGAVLLEGVSGADVGSTSSFGKNIVSGSASSIAIRSSVSRISEDINVIGNYIGVLDDGALDYGNYGGQGVIVESAANVLLRSNIIRNSKSSQGVAISGNAQKVSILQNSIYNNQGIGIDLNGDSNHNPNDPSDTDSGPNDMLNSPGYTSIVENAGNTEVEFSLDVPAGNYRIEFFSNTAPDASGIGEGETYLGFVNITHTGSGLEEFNHTLSGTGHTNLALTTTEIDPSTPSGFGASSEFGGSGQSVANTADMSLSIKLQNPEDFAIGNTLNYQYTLKNHGPQPIDISQYNEMLPNNGLNLLTGILHPQVTYSGVTGDVACNYLGDGSAVAFGPILANHSDHGLFFCGYSGASPRVLDPGDTFSFTVSAQVLDDSNPNFSIYGISAPSLDNDPDQSQINQVISNSLELVDHFTQNTFINSFAWATSTPADVEITKTLDNPQDVEIGNNLNYNITFTNNGPSTLDPTQFNLSGPNPMMTALFVDLLPPNLTYASQSNPDVVCSDAGEAGVAAPATFASASTHHLVICGYFGADTSLANGEAISTTITATVGSVPSSFTNYVMGLGTRDDSDWQIVMSEIFTGGDIIASLPSLNTNNFDSHTYTSSYDHDGDGIADQTEDSLAPNGDGNGDGTPDKLQSDVASTPNSITGEYTTLAVAGDCDQVTAFEVVPESSLPVLDTQYDYPLGLKDFTLDCGSPGGTATATIYYDKVYSESSYQVRKFMSPNYSDLVDATLGTADVNGNTVTTITYNLTDGGAIDADNTTNSSITDPVGLGLKASPVSSVGDGLKNTGSALYVAAALTILLILSGLVIKRRKLHFT